jgi:2,4-dienoyl-CoA reductase (NADPH2)
MKFVLEIIRGIREELGDYPLLVRINGLDGIEGGLTLADSIEISKCLEEGGADAIHVSVGAAAAVAAGNFIASVAPGRLPPACIVNLAQEIKAHVSIPVIAVNRINSLDLAEEILREGKADIVAMGRALLADPQIINKSLRGEKLDVRPCIGDCGCTHQLVVANRPVTCTVNPRVGKEGSYKLRKAAQSKKIVIVGGGPAGLEAALNLSKRGHQVIVLEREDKVGGQLWIACRPPGKGDIEKLADYYERKLKDSGIEIQFNITATSQYVRDLNPDAIVVASGSRPLIPKSFSTPKTFTVFEVLTQELELGSEVVVIGGGGNGAETAEYLAERGKKVTIIDQLDEIAQDLATVTKAALLFSLANQHVTIMTNTVVEGVRDGELLLARGDKKLSIKADSIVVAVGHGPNNEIVEEMKKVGCEVYTCGDVNKPRDILSAVREGLELGLKI